MTKLSRSGRNTLRASAVLRAAAFFFIVQWLATPIIVRPILRAIGTRFGFVTDFTNHVFSAPRVLIQDILVIALGLMVATLLILSERRAPGFSLFTAVMRRTNLSDGRPWAGRYAIGCITAPILLSMILGILAAAGLMRVSLQDAGVTDFIRHQAVLIPTFATAGLAEEFLIRGYLLRALADGLGFWAAMLLTSVCFALGHYAEGDTPGGSIGVFEFAIFSCLAIRATGSLVFSAGFHAAWDYTESAIYGVPDSSFFFAGALGHSTFRGPAVLTGGAAGPEASVLLLAVMAAMILVLLRYTSSDNSPPAAPRLYR